MAGFLSSEGGVSGTAMAICLILILALEANAVKGKMGPMASVVGVIHLGIALLIALLVIMQFL